MRVMEAVTFQVFEKSVASLRRAVAMYAQFGEGDLHVMARNSMILEFEICFGQVRPSLERCLAEFEGLDSRALDEMTFAALIRTANERGYTEVPWSEWRQFRDERNRTAHAYSEPAAERIAAGIPQFLSAAEGLLRKMQEKGKIA